MEEIVLYGLGKRFFNDYFLKYLIPEIRKKYKIAGVSDRRKPEELKKYDFDFINRSSELTKYNYIIVTSDIYFEEIKGEMMTEYNVPSEKIISLDDVEKEIVGNIIHSELFIGMNGVEIGGPSPVFDSIYSAIEGCDGVNFRSDTVWWDDRGNGYEYKSKHLGEVIIADATNLKCIEDNKYDFCISSNNLEHIANPIKAVSEFERITKKDGLLLILVPCKELCFDHRRQVTPFEHLMDDFLNNTDENDLSHLDEILELHDFEMDAGVTSKEQFKQRALNNFDNRCLHHHVFDEELLNKIFEYKSIRKICSGKIYNNYYILGRVNE